MVTKKTAASPPPASNGSAGRVPKLHVQMRDGAWRVREGRHLSPPYATDEDAVRAARAIGKERNVEILLYRADGSFKYVVSQDPTDDFFLEVWKRMHERRNGGRKVQV